jgi:c-di-GMP-binding flagellar brake protein YcgR
MEQSKMKDTRRYERFPCAQMVTIRPKNGKNAQSEDSRAIVVDVSLGGLKMRTRSTLEPTTPYILTMAGRGEPVEFNGTVVHLADGSENEEAFVGFVFRPESHEERVAIANFVHGVFTQAWHAEAA